MSSLSNRQSSSRIFAVSGVISLITLCLVYVYLGMAAMLVTLVLIMIEITFSFDNAIVNARVLAKMSDFWQKIFMTVGMLIAVFGMRVLFPILVVTLTSGLSWMDTINLALHQPQKYAEHLADAHTSIAAFGGMFLLMLALQFFSDSNREVRWIHRIERPLQKIGTWWTYTLISLGVLIVVTALSLGGHPMSIFIAGLVGIAVYLLVNGFTELLEKKYGETKQPQGGEAAKRVGLVGLATFIYLEVLDASFSFDGVIGAFAITNDVILIALGLGVGALWVRSITIFMVQRKVLSAYRYLEHGAHYTIGILAIALLVGLFYDIPNVITGVVGVGIIGLAVFSSIKANKQN